MWLFKKTPKIGRINFVQSTLPEIVASKPPTKDRLKGVLRLDRSTGKTFFFSYDQQKNYYTFQEYGEWVGMVCEAKVQVDETILRADVEGYAYQIFVQSLGNGLEYELPSPEVIQRFPKSHHCRCPFCMIEFASEN